MLSDTATRIFCFWELTFQESKINVVDMRPEWLEEIEDLERRARDINLTLGYLCVTTKVAPSNLCRWRKGEAPSMRSFIRDIGKLQTKLAQLELSMFLRLADKISPEAAPTIRELIESGDNEKQNRQKGGERAGADRCVLGASGTERAA